MLPLLLHAKTVAEVCAVSVRLGLAQERVAEGAAVTVTEGSALTVRLNAVEVTLLQSPVTTTE